MGLGPLTVSRLDSTTGSYLVGSNVPSSKPLNNGTCSKKKNIGTCATVSSIMIQYGHPSMTSVRTRLHRSGSILSETKKKKQILTPSYAYPPSPEAAWPLIRPRPFPHRTLVGYARCALHPPPSAPSPAASSARPSHMCRSLPRLPSVCLPSLLCAPLTPP